MCVGFESDLKCNFSQQCFTRPCGSTDDEIVFGKEMSSSKDMSWVKCEGEVRLDEFVWVGFCMSLSEISTTQISVLVAVTNIWPHCHLW